jgi:hypothetical protein
VAKFYTKIRQILTKPNFMDRILSPIKERVLQFIVNHNITKETFFETTGITASNFKGIGLKSELGGDKIAKILTCYPEISPEWLLTGIGEMLRASAQHFVSDPLLSTDKEKLLLQILDRKDKEIKELNREVGALSVQMKQMQERIRILEKEYSYNRYSSCQ